MHLCILNSGPPSHAAHSGFYENALYKFTFTYFYLLTPSQPHSISTLCSLPNYTALTEERVHKQLESMNYSKAEWP